ncbi:hypothetical protein ACFE04_021139 [Oxalis oulophora]
MYNDCCWAIVCAASISSLRAIRAGEDLIAYSHQQLLDGAAHEGATYDDVGCFFSHYKRGYDFVIKRGFSTLADYPYTGTQNHTYDWMVPKKPVIATYRKIDDNNQDEFLRILSEQPVAACVKIFPEFKKHKNGTYVGPPDGTNRNYQGLHAVLAVGYDKDNLFIRNSHGPEWGENGDAKVARNVRIKDNDTQKWRPLLQSLYYPLLESDLK